METHRLSRIAVALLFFVLSLPAFAGPSGRTGVSGQIVGLSTAAQTLTLQAADGKQTVLKVTTASHLWRNGSPAGLAGLALRDTVLTGQIDRGTLRVVSLRTRGPAVTTTRGGLAEVDPTLKSLSVSTPSGTREFQITSSTLFVRNGRAATAQDLTARDSVVVHALPSTTTAADVEADGPEAGEVEGTISALAGSDVTITPKQGAAVTVHATDATVIRVHLPGGSTAGSLADLRTGQRAEASFDPVSFAAFRIDAEREDDHYNQIVEGRVTAVDGTARTVTIAPEHGNPVTLTADGATRIRLDGATAALADIQVGDEANAEYDPATKVAVRIDAKSEDGGHHEPAEVEGRVTATTADTVTITPRTGSPVTVKVNASTVILIGDHAGTVADIKVGDGAEARYDPGTLEALGIKVEREEENEPAEVEGRITEVFTDAVTITPDHGSPVRLHVTSSTVIVVNDKPGTLADLKVGASAQAKYDRATLTAFGIRAANPHD